MHPRELIGQNTDALTTPALVVDEAGLDANLRLLADYFRDRPCKLRPHFKSHKCVTLARRQLAAGSAVGITAAKLSEAEVLVAGGVADVLIANQILGPARARRVAALNRQALVRVTVDSPANVEELGAAAVAACVTVGVLVEVDIGMDRCGVAPGEATLELARKVAATDGLRFDGLQGFEGHVVTVRDPGERRAKVSAAMALLVKTRELLERSGMPSAIVSGGGTGTYDVTGNIEGVDELQAGTYALMDVFYRAVRPEFVCCRWVLATVISTRPGKATVDVGLKGVGSDFGPPEVVGFPDANPLYVAEEHIPIENVDAAVGDRLKLIPSHGCTTNNLHRLMWVVRDETIVDVWPIEGSGCLE